MIMVSVPYYRTPWLVRRAVDLLLAQTYRDLRIVVTGDGDGPSLRLALSEIRDRRLLRFDLEKNRGRYYADAVALRANPYPLFSVHDADDWSTSTRFGRLVDLLGEADAVADGYIRHGLNEQTQVYKPRPNLVGYRAGRSLWHIAHHKGLWRTDQLRLLGMGPQFRVGWDTYLMHFAALCLTVEWAPCLGYHQQRRKGSLTQSPRTGIQSKLRADTIVELDRLWESGSRAPESVPALLAPTRDLAERIDADAARLRELL